MRILDLSGASTKIAGHAGAVRALRDLGYRPDIIVGVSSGALASVPIALGMHDELKEITTKISIDDFFDVPPVDYKGRVRLGNAIKRVILGKNSIGVQNVSKVIRKFITEEIFEHYRIGRHYPDCYALAIDINSNKRVYFRIKDLSYDEYLKVMEATSAIPFATEPVAIDGGLFYDGGVLDHIGGVKFLEYAKTKGISATDIITIFSRPETLGEMGKGWHKDIFGVASRLWTLNIYSISKDDEEMQKEYCKAKHISLKQMFMPKVLGGLYDTDNDALLKLYNDSYRETIAQFKRL